MKCLLLFCLSWFSCSLLAAEVRLTGTTLTFVAPDEFEPFSQAIIAAKWPARRAPRWVVGNASTSTSIAYDIKQNDISTAPLHVVMNSLKNTMQRIGPGLQWVKTEVVDIHGKAWVYLEFTSQAINADIHNIMLVSAYDKQMIIFNFNSTKAEFTQYEALLRESVQSIKMDGVS